MNPGLDAAAFAQIAATMSDSPTPASTAQEAVGFAREQLDADHAGITLVRSGHRLETLAPSDDLVEKVDALQHELAEGPCRDTSWQGDTLVVPDIGRDDRWPHWGPQVAALGIVSALSVELATSDARRIGSVNLYWSVPRTFDRDDVAFAHVFARHAAIAIAGAIDEANLNLALDGRKRIGQAQGILMERYGLDEARAFEVLRRYSQNHNRKLRHVADDLVATRALPPDR